MERSGVRTCRAAFFVDLTEVRVLLRPFPRLTVFLTILSRTVAKASYSTPLAQHCDRSVRSETVLAAVRRTRFGLRRVILLGTHRSIHHYWVVPAGGATMLFLLL